MKVTIRRYKSEDWPGVSRVVLSAVNKTFPGEQPRKGVERYRQGFHPKTGIEKERMTLLGRVVFVAVARNKIVGVLRGKVGVRVGMVYVLPTMQKRGIGRLLLQHFFTYSKKKGEYIVRLRSTPSAIPFYKKVGFRKAGGIRRNKKYHVIYQPMRIVLS